MTLYVTIHTCIHKWKTLLSFDKNNTHERKTIMEMKTLEALLVDTCKKPLNLCNTAEIYGGLLNLTQALANEKTIKNEKKKVYYISAEFLIGKLLSNNLINLGIYDDVRNCLSAHGHQLSDVEEFEAEPSLGNGGLGRLAACFLDSIATLGLNGDGIGLNYHFGLFKQTFKNNKQFEIPNPWAQDATWLEKTDVTYTVPFKKFTLTSRMYDISVTGYHNTTNKLHLFDVESVDESLVGEGIDFDKKEIAKNLTLFLYPDDSDKDGELLRIYQQYFMVSNGARLILAEALAKGSDLYDLNEYAVIQINDTHPSMVIPELIRILTTEHGFDMDDAIDVVSKTCAYTNHTILSEALEKWPIAYLKEVVPQLIPIIEILDDKIRRKFDDPSVVIIDKQDRVHMAHLDIHYGFSVNGVAALHTDILKSDELNNFYKIYPEKFNNKTNGITFRRWLLHCNKELAKWIDETIGEDYKTDATKLEQLGSDKFLNDDSILDTLLSIKSKKKEDLAEYLKRTQGLTIDPTSIYDIQIKRLHEYKRQQMNALYLVWKYLEIKSGKIPATPITAIFGAKAAPAYTIAKDIIHMILCLKEIIANDKDVSPYLTVVMVENYNVTLAENLIPACDISEQISLASKEASGTGNMKFMLNGAITLGTEDGANVEIHELVGDDNIYVFGEDSDTVIARYKAETYKSKSYYDKNKKIKTVVDFITGPEMLKVGSKENLERLSKELLGKDWFMTFPDFDAYLEIKEKAYEDYNNRKEWAKKMLVNISKAGYFSSDRTIAQYNKDIWKL